MVRSQPWPFRLVHGGISVCRGCCVDLDRAAVCLVRPIPVGRAFWIQYHNAAAVVDGPAEGSFTRPGARLPAAGADFEVGRLDRALVVAVGLGSLAGLPIVNGR